MLARLLGGLLRRVKREPLTRRCRGMIMATIQKGRRAMPPNEVGEYLPGDPRYGLNAEELGRY